MYSLEQELQDLGSSGALDDTETAWAMSLERRAIFSVFTELRTALYAAVVLVINGVGILVKEHIDRIGPLTLILGLAVAAAACYAPAIRARSRRTEQSIVSDYLLLLGALIVSADVGYAESRFHWLGADWSRDLLFLAVFHGYASYALRSRLVLCVALTTLAGWFGIERVPENLWPWHVAALEFGLRGLACSAAMLVWRAVDQRVNAARFREIFEHFAANLAFWGAISWCYDASMRVGGVVTLVLLAAVCVREALRSRRETFAVYGVGYAAFGLSLVVTQVTGLTLPGAIFVLLIVLTAAAGLYRLHDLIRGRQT